MLRIIATVITSLLLVHVSAAQSFDAEKMDRLLDLVEKENQGMGSLSLYQDGQEVYQKAIGYASLEEELKADVNTHYRIGSITKVFTATVVLQLVEAGEISLETKLEEFFPEIPNADKIDIEMLLRHRSGLYSFTSDETYMEYMESVQGREDMLKRIREYKPSFEPGEKYEYSNTGYYLLSAILEEKLDASYDDIIKKKVCKPCKLAETYYGSQIDPASNEARSYQNYGEWELATETDLSIPMGAGGIVSTASDLNTFLNCLFAEKKLVSEEGLSKMKNVKDGYGLGLVQVPFGSKRAYGHNGGIDGFQSQAFYFPEEKLSISYLSNGVVMPINDLMIGILSIYFGEAYDLPTFEEVEIPVETLETYVGEYSSSAMPLKISISREGKRLFGKASGQPQFPLTAVSEKKFEFSPAALVIEFPEADQMVLKQGGGIYEFSKE